MSAATLRPRATRASAVAARRTATTFFPDEQPSHLRPPPPRPKPSSPSWFTGKPTYVDILRRLDATTHDVRQKLWSTRILPSYNAAPADALEQLGLGELASSSKARDTWASKEDMARLVSLKVRDAQYRALVARLDRLKSLMPHADLADKLEDRTASLSATISQALAPFHRRSEGTEKPAPRKLGHVDELGRAYAVGRRKTASVRVWMIPVKAGEGEAAASNGTATAPATVGAVVVNKLPLPQALPYPSDRALALRPFVVTRTLGRYNVFAIANGGGTTGWAGALQLGIAKCLAQLITGPARDELKKANLLRRDPRIVLRKMPGKPKHSKANQWVKR